MRKTLALILTAILFATSSRADSDWALIERGVIIPFNWTNSIEVMVEQIPDINEDGKLEIHFVLDEQYVKYHLTIKDFIFKSGEYKRRRRRDADYWRFNLEYEIVDTDQKREANFTIKTSYNEPRWTFRKREDNSKSKIEVLFEDIITGEISMFEHENHVEGFRFSPDDTISLLHRVTSSDKMITIDPGQNNQFCVISRMCFC